MRSRERLPRVVFFNPSLNAIGGMQAWLATLMPDLQALGWDVWLALPDGPHNDAAAYLANYPFDPCLRVVNPTLSRIGQLRAVQRALAAVDPQILVVAHLVSAYPAVADLRARGKPAPRVVASFHAQSGGMFSDLERQRDVIDAVVAPSRLLAAASTALGTTASERVFLASYGIDIPSLESGPERATDRRLELVFAHRLDDEQKRLRDLPPLVAALERRKIDFSLDIVGSGPDEPWLRQAFEGTEGAHRVHFVGPVAPDRLRELALKPERILLVTSHWENGPIVAFQAMAWGTLVVSSQYVGSVREGFLRDGVNSLLFAVGDIEGAAAQIARLRDPALRRRLAASAWTSVRDRYSRPVAAAAWDRALRGILELPPLPKPPRSPEVLPAGRLDRWLGIEGAELVRRILRRPARVSDSGDEWPHTGGGGLPPRELFARLAALDQSGHCQMGPHTDSPGGGPC